MLQEMPIAPRRSNPEVPPEIDRIVMRALAHDPEARYQTAGEMATDLEQVMLEERMSPREHIKMLHQLFPHEAMMSADAGVMLPTATGKMPAADGERPTPPRSVDTGGLFATLDKDATKAPNSGAGALDAVDVSVSESGLARWMELLRGARAPRRDAGGRAVARGRRRDRVDRGTSQRSGAGLEGCFRPFSDERGRPARQRTAFCPVLARLDASGRDDRSCR